MSRAKDTVLPLAASLIATLASAMEHVGLSPEDRFVQCARGVLGRPILLCTGSRWPNETIPCPADKGSLIEALKAMGILVFEADGWSHLVSAGQFKPTTGAHAAWERLHVKQAIKEWGLPGSRSLTADEEDQIAMAILEQARPPVAHTPIGANDTIKLLLFLDAHAFGGKLRRESVVAIWGSEGEARRLIYGEIDAGTYVPLWDSPLFPGEWLQIGYRDLDGDGTEEIILQSKMGTSGRGLGLIAFDLKGHEISRQADKRDCDWLRHETRPDVTCPIGGAYTEGVEYVVRKDGKTDIIVYQGSVPIRFRLVNGRYLRQKAESQVTRTPSS